MVEPVLERLDLLEQEIELERVERARGRNGPGRRLEAARQATTCVSPYVPARIARGPPARVTAVRRTGRRSAGDQLAQCADVEARQGDAVAIGRHPLEVDLVALVVVALGIQPRLGVEVVEESKRPAVVGVEQRRLPSGEWMRTWVQILLTQVGRRPTEGRGIAKRRRPPSRSSPHPKWIGWRPVAIARTMRTPNGSTSGSVRST